MRDPRHDLPLSIGRDNANPGGIGFLALVAEDYRTHGRDPLSQGFWALFWHRFGNWRMGWPRLLRPFGTVLYRIGYKASEWLCGVHLPYPVQVGRRVRIEHFGGIVLAPRAIGDDVVIRQNVTMGLAHEDRPAEIPVIGHRVQIGAGAVIVGAVTVGDDAVIGANAVVVRDVPAGATVGGVPARILDRPRVADSVRPLANPPD